VLRASLRPQLELWLGWLDIKEPYQEGKNNAGLPGHDASWTGHYTTGEGPVTSTDPDY